MTSARRNFRKNGLRLLTAGVLAGAALAVTGQGASAPAVAAPAGTVHLPDLQTIIPLDSFSVADGDSGKEFRYTHLIYNGGEGPLQVQPFYRASAGNYLGRQQLTTHDANDNWSVTSTRPVADAFVYHAEHGHFHFPLATFGLYKITAADGVGAAVTLSPKIGFCIADSYIYNHDLEHSGQGHDLWGNCADPLTMRGISVGGADEYDYRDPGQAVPLTGVPDGSYWFRAISDPNNDFVESDESNNEEDVKVTLSKGKVIVGEHRNPDTTPCTSTLLAPAAGTTQGSTVRLSSSTSVGNPAKVSYLVDGRPAGSTAGAAPYAVAWNSAKVVDGTHWMAARVTTSAGRVCTSPVVEISVDNSAGPGPGEEPAITFSDPEPNGKVGGRVAIAVQVADSSPVTSVQFTLDGKRLGAARTKPPYTVTWNSRSTKPGRHTIGARATDRAGRVKTRTLKVKVVHLPPPKLVTKDASVVERGAGTLTSPPVTTHVSSELLIAMVSLDGPEAPGQQGATVSGAHLKWRLVKRSNTQSGDSEIWAARSSGRLHGSAVHAVPLVSGYHGMLSVFSFRHAAGTGVASAAGAPAGAPGFYVPAVQEGSRVFAAGNDWDGAVARTPVAGQSIRRSWVDTAAGDTFWVQALNAPTTAQRLITITDTAPTDHQWNYVAVEVRATH